jgi:hypothetical protein
VGDRRLSHRSLFAQARLGRRDESGRPGDLGEGAKLEPDKGTPYETNDGTTAEVRGYPELDRVRVTHRLPGTDEETTVQVTVSDAATGKTVLRFHQERMASREERERQRGHWEGVMQRVVAALER